MPHESGGPARCDGDTRGEALTDLVDSPWDVAAADLDGDRDVDLVVAQAPGSLTAPGAEPARGVRLLLNMGDSARSGVWRCVQLRPIELTNRLVVGDIDGDGQIDVVGGTWQTREVRWWRLRADGTPIASEKMTISLAEATRGAPASCGKPEEADVVLSSLALGDPDANARPELAVTLYRRDQETQPCVNQQFFSFDAASNRFASKRRLSGPGFMRGRFADVDGDGRIDFVGSAYAVQCPDGDHTTCGNTGVWGWWYRSLGRDRKQLVTSLLVDRPDWIPRFTAVDFDVWPSGLAERTRRLTGRTAFAVAISGLDACNSPDCWNPKAQGGYVAFVRSDGSSIGSSAEAERAVETARPDGAYLFPEAVVMLDGAAETAAAATYRWVKYCAGPSCANADTPLVPAGGAIMTYRDATTIAPSFDTYGTAMRMQGFALLPGGSADDLLTIEDEPSLAEKRRIAYLRSRNVVAVDRVWTTRGGDPTPRPLRFSWFPGDSWITLVEPASSTPLHVVYRALARRAVAAADSSSGLILQQ